MLGLKNLFWKFAKYQLQVQVLLKAIAARQGGVSIILPKIVAGESDFGLFNVEKFVDTGINRLKKSLPRIDNLFLKTSTTFRICNS